MSPILAILLFVEFEPTPNDPVLELLISNGGSRWWSEGVRFIMQFESPTQAIVASESVLRYLPKLDGEDRVRFYIDTCEISLEGSTHVGSAVNLGWTLLSRGEWNMVHFSESTRLTLKHSEHQFLSRPEKWLEQGVGKVLLHRLVLNYSDSRIPRDVEYGEVFDSLSAISPAPHGRRAFAGVLDFLLALSILLAIRIIMNGPLVYSVISTRKLVEAEHMQIRHGYISPTWLASSGAAVHMGRRGTLSFPFPFKTGAYKVRVVLKTGDDDMVMKFQVGDRTFSWVAHGSGVQFGDRVSRDGKDWAEFIPIANGEMFSVQKGDSEGHSPYIDYIQFVAPEDNSFVQVKGQNILRSEDFLRLIGVWEYTDIKYHLRDVLVLCPAIQMLLHIIFLSFVPWTPGSLVAGVRIIRRNGPRVPGVYKAIQRVAGYVISVIPFMGVGLIWPLVVNKNENWADVLSKTRVVTSGGQADEE